MKKEAKISFGNLIVFWVCIAIPLGLLNVFFFKVPILHNIILSTLGIVLLIYPVYPMQLTAKFTEKQCKLFIRVLAVIEILLSFVTKMTF